jgi:hypothetical protein
MRRYIARQIVQLVVVIIGISILSFGILHVIGDPVLLLLPQNAGKEEFERYRHLLGLDRPPLHAILVLRQPRRPGRLRPVLVRETPPPSGSSSSACRTRSTSPSPGSR